MALTGVLAQAVLSLVGGGSSSRRAAKVCVFPDPPGPRKNVFPFLIQSVPSDIASSKWTLVLSLTVNGMKEDYNNIIMVGIIA